MGSHRMPRWLAVLCAAVGLWLVAPSLVVLPLSFTDRASFEFPPKGWSLRTVDRRLELAAAGLGAPPWATFRRVTLPLVLPGVLSGAVFAFVTSFDEVVFALFLQSPTPGADITLVDLLKTYPHAPHPAVDR